MDDGKGPVPPPGTHVGKVGNLTNLKALHQNQEGRDKTVNEVPSPKSPTDADYPSSETFSKGTKGFLKTGGVD